MPIRRHFGLKLAAGAVVAAAAVAYSAFGQAPLPVNDPPKYYPGSVTPNPAYNGAYGTPPARPQSGPLPPPGGALPSPGGALPSAQPPQRLTQPVIAGPTGVRPVSAGEADLTKPTMPTAGELPKPAFFPTPPPAIVQDQPPTLPLPTPDLPKPAPTVVPERTGPLPPGPPVFPVPGGPGTENPRPAPPAVELPKPSAPPSPPVAANLTSKAAPAVAVEFESPESVGVGQPCTYTLVVRNTGTIAVSGVRVDHDLPAGAAYGSSEPNAESAGEGKLAWTVGNIEAGGEKRLKVTVTPAEEGEFRGRASVTFAAAVEARVKVTRPRIAVTLTGPDVVRVGEPVVFQVKMTNTGSGPASKMKLQARFTEGLKHKNGQVIEGQMVNLDAGQTKTFPLEVVAARPGQETFVMSVFADANPPETAKAAVTLVEPQLVAKQTGPAKCWVRAEPTYQIDLTNPGSAATDPIQMWTAVPDGFEFVQASDGGMFNATNKSVVWRLNGLPAGGSKAITVKLRAVGPTDSAIRTTVQAAAVEQPAAPGVTPAAAVRGKPLEARAETAVKAEGVAALRFDVQGAEGIVEVGKEAVYEIKVTNQGTGPCNNVQIIAELAEGTSMVASAGPTNARAQGTQTIVFDVLPQVAVKGEAIYRVRVKGNQPGDLRFRVKLTCDQIRTPVVKEENTKFFKE